MAEKQQKEITVKIDSTPMEQRIRDEYEEKLKARDSTIASLLIQEKERIDLEAERQKAVYALEGRKPPVGGDTARLDQEVRANQQVTTFNLAEDSYIPVEFVRGKNTAEVIHKIESIANSQAENSEEYTKILSRLTKKMLNSNKELNIEFRGSSKEFIKTPLTVSEFDSEEVRARKVAYNERLRNNRCSWRNLNED